MQLRRWNTKRIAMVCCGLMVLYFLFSSGYHKYEIDCVIKHSNPKDVWEYVADFSKMRLLNPTIISFKIISDSGNVHDWRYTVKYVEKLSHWPYWINEAKAHYIVRQSLSEAQPKFYTIESQHETCFFRGAYCRKYEEFRNDRQERSNLETFRKVFMLLVSSNSLLEAQIRFVLKKLSINALLFWGALVNVNCNFSEKPSCII